MRVIIGIFILAILSLFGITQAQSIKLGKNIDIYNNDSFAGFEILDEEVNKHRLILSGENHNYLYKNIIIETKLFRYLVKNKNVRHLLIEQGYSLGQMLNRYITTGDTGVLEKLETVSSTSYFRFYKNLRSLYLSLPDSQKFKVHSIDVERFYHQAITYLSFLIPKDKAVPEELLLDVQSLYSMENFLVMNNEDNRNSGYDKYQFSYNPLDYDNRTYINLPQSISLFINSFDSLSSGYKNYLGNDYNEFEKIVNSLREKQRYESLSGTAQQIVFREQFIFKKFESLANMYTEDRFFGQFGRCHATDTIMSKECDWYAVSSFLNRVNQSKTFATPCKGFGIGLGYSSFFESNHSSRYKTSFVYALSPYMAKVKEDQSMIFPLNNDSNNVFLTNRYKFILVSKLNAEEIPLDDDTTKIKPGTKGVSASDLYNYVHYSFSYGRYSMKLTGLQSSLKTMDIHSPIESFGFHYLVNFKDGEPSFGNSFFKFRKQTTNSGTDTNFMLEGYNLGFQLGYDVLQKSKKVCIIPLIGINYQQIKLTPVIKNQGGNFPFSSMASNDIYKNPAFILTPQLDVRVNLFSVVWIGLKGGYALDVSKKEWRLNGKLRETNVPVNQSGLFFEAILSFGTENAF